MVSALGWQVRAPERVLSILINVIARFCCKEALSRSHNCFKPILQVHRDVTEGYGYLPPV